MFEKVDKPNRYEVLSDSRGELYRGKSLTTAFKVMQRDIAQCTKSGICADAVLYRDGEPMKLQEDDDGKLSFESE